MNRNTVMNTLGIILLILIAYYSRVFHTSVSNPIYKMILVMIRSVIQVSLVITWCSSVRARIINNQVKRYLLLVGILLAFWLTLRTCKWEFISYNGTNFGRYCWYGYYIPIIFVPLLGVFIIDHIGKADNYKTPKGMKYLYIIACLLVAAVFTNDLHQLVFSFPLGFEYCESNNHYGFLYFAIMVWCVFLSFYFIIMLLKKSRIPVSKKFQKFPAIILIGAIIFWVLYGMRIAHGDVAAVNCIMIILLLESAIQSGLIPSNTKYNELFRISTVSAQIIDNTYNPCILSGTAVPLPFDVMKRAETNPVNMGDTILHSKSIRGGHVLWQDDIRQINTILEQLRDTRERLGENNELLRAELDLKEKRVRTEEKSRLYDRVAKEVSPQLKKAEELLNLAKTDPPNMKSVIARISVIFAYIKRRGNLLLISEEGKYISAKELEYCIRESLDNLSLGNISTFFDSSCEGNMLSERLVAAFDFYEDIVEALFDNATAMLVHLACKNGVINMRLQIGCNQKISKHIFDGLSIRYGEYKWEIHDEDITVTLLISRGGGIT